MTTSAGGPPHGDTREDTRVSPVAERGSEPDGRTVPPSDPDARPEPDGRAAPPSEVDAGSDVKADPAGPGDDVSRGLDGRTGPSGPRPALLRRAIPLHPLLFAVYPVLFLYSQNLTEATLADLLPVLGQVALVSLALLAALTVLLRDPARAGIVSSALTVAFVTFDHVDRALPPTIRETEQIVGWLVVILGAVVFALRARRSLRIATSGLNVAASALVALALVSIVPHELSRVGQAAPLRTPVVEAGQPGPPGAARDIYYLVFDRYGSRESLGLRYGIENDLPAWLASRGFYVADRSHANYPRTALSLASALNMTYLDELTERYGRQSGDLEPTYRMVRDHAVGRFLKSQGYRYIHVGSWFQPTLRSEIADENRNRNTSSEFSAAFYERTALPLLSRLRGDEPKPGDRHAESALFQFEELELLRSAPGPKFVFAHVLMPHPPYVFRADGSRATAADRKAPERVRFAEQLRFTNDRIRQIVDGLLALPEASRPIIVLQADEGPYLPGNFGRGRGAEAARIRAGILTAFYLPGEGSPRPYQTITPVNTFRLILSRYFGADLPLLPDRSFWWRSNRRIYDFHEITHLFDGPMPPRRGKQKPVVPSPDASPRPTASASASPSESRP